MSVLSAPTVREPIYECASSLGISGYVPGAQISIFAAPPGGGPAVPIGGGVSNSANGQIFGVSQAYMVPDAQITAVQTYSGNSSPPSAEVTVQRALGVDAPILRAPLLECARCVRVDGLLPGVRVEVRDGGTTLGQSSAAGPAVSVGIAPPLVPGHTISARQVYCGTPGPDAVGLLVASVRDPALQLPAPEVDDPLFACQPGCIVRGCVPGCQVEVFVNGMPNTAGCAAGTSVNLRVAGGLVEGWSITAQLSLCGGALQSLPSAAIGVQPASNLPRPAIWPPLYAGDSRVLVAMTVDGELVTITADHTPIGMGGGGGGNALLNVDPPLVAGQRVVATVELCGVKKESLPVTVLPAPTTVPAPTMVEPLYACSLLVNVAGCIPGSDVRVFAESGGNTVLLGVMNTLGTSATVAITPPLQVGWAIHATQQVGGITSLPSAAAIVIVPPAAIPAPTLVEPILACARCVQVENLIVGARIDVYQDHVWVGGAEASAPKTGVSVYPGLTAGATITATQTVCGTPSEASRATVSRGPEQVPPPQVLSAFANRSYVEATDLVPGALVEVEELSIYNQVIGEACAPAQTAAIGVNLPLFAGARVRARQRLCQPSPYSPTINVSQPEEWPLGPGPYKAGYRLVSDIPVSAGITFQGGPFGPCNGGTYDFIRPATNKAIIFYPAGADGENQPVAAAGPLPILVFGHGRRWPSCFDRWEACPGAPTDTGQDYQQLSGILSHMARWGFVSIAPDLSWFAPHNVVDDWALVLADAAHYLIAEHGNAGSPFHGQFQTAAVSLMGHSTSGLAAIELTAGGQLSVAALALLAPAGGAATVATVAPTPVLVLCGTRDTGPFGDGGQSDNVYAAAGPKKHKVTIDGGNHFGFTDALCILFDPAAIINQADQQKIARAYLMAFFHRYIQGAQEVEDYLTGARLVEELEGFTVTVEAQI